MKRNFLSKKLTAIVLAASVTTGLVTENVYAEDRSEVSSVATKESYSEDKDNEQIKIALIIPSTMEISEDEASDITETVKKRIEEINNVTIVSMESSVGRFGNTARVVVSVISSDGRTGEGSINVTIVGEESKGDLIIPTTMEIYQDEASDIVSAVKKRIEEINNVTIVSMESSIIQFGNTARVVVSVTSSDGRTGEGDISVRIVKRPIVISIPNEIQVKEGYDIEKEIKKEIYELNNPEDIQEIYIELNSNDEGIMAMVVVTDSDGKVTSKDIRVIVVPNSAPSIEADDRVVKVGEEFNPLDGIKATDVEDGDITDKIEVVENNVDTTKEGEYKVVYKVTDSQGASFIKEIKVIVELGLIELNNAPYIDVNDKVIKVGDKFNPLDGVKATDVEDGDITDKIEIIENNVDTSKKGRYKVVYTVTDSQGVSFTKIINVTVEGKPTESNTINDKDDSGNTLSKPLLPETGGSNSAFALSGALTSILSGMFIGKKKRR